MKKLLTFMLVGAMIFSLAACGRNTMEERELNTDESIGVEMANEDARTGGYKRADSPVITDDIKALIDKATRNMVGTEYTPVAYIGSQVVAGINHCILCKVAAVTVDAKMTYALVYIYEDLEGNAKITGVLACDAEAGTTDLAGGWNETESPVITEDITDVFEKATENITGVESTMVAYLANQIVSGMNYCVFCEVKAISPNAEATYNLMYIYEDLDGNAKITETVDFNATNIE